VHPSAQAPGAPQRPTAQTPAPAPQAPTAQSPATTPQRPTAQQPNGAPPAAAQRPGFTHPTAQQPLTAPPATAAQPQAQPPHPTAQQAPAPAAAAPVARDRDEALQQRQRAEEWRSRRVQDLHNQRQQVQEGNRTVIREPDRTIIKEEGRTIIRHDEVARFGFKARDIQVQQRGRDTVTVVERPGGVRIVTVVDADGRLLRRSRRGPDGREIIIIDNPVHEYHGPHAFFVELPPPVIRIPRERYIVETEHADEAAIYAALTAPPVDRLERRYTLEEVRYSPMLRDRMPRVDIDTVTFDSGSWVVTPEQAARLAGIAEAIRRAVERNPQEVFLIEGHTDAVGSDVDNLSLSDRRAESVAMVLSDQFGVPPENLTTQGYGEQYLKIPTEGPERRNRRVTVRRITPLIAGENGQRPG
jgi:outer membrane protein OmpA-like peptidoglycan-associated protein